MEVRVALQVKETARPLSGRPTREHLCVSFLLPSAYVTEAATLDEPAQAERSARRLKVLALLADRLHFHLQQADVDRWTDQRLDSVESCASTSGDDRRLQVWCTSWLKEPSTSAR